MNISITSKKNHFFKILLLTLITFTAFQIVDAQTMDRIERGRMKDMLKDVKNKVKDNYYDTNYHGIDLDARFKQAEERLDQVTTVGQSFGVIAQVLMDFEDSHLFFIPPSTNLKVQYPWKMQMIGDRCFVMSVKPKSDAEAKGLKVGDQILAVESFRPNRKDMWKILYYYNLMGIREKLKLTVLSPDSEQPREIEIKSEIKKQPSVITFQSYYRLFDDFYDEENDRNRTATIGNILIWKMPSFGIDPADATSYMGIAKRSSSLILDLRGNGGGYVKTLEELTAYFFDKDINIAELKGRKKMDPQKAKTKGSQIFDGKLIVLVDSNSGSAAEIFARVIQLEKRGIVLGDTSAGAVMQSQQLVTEMGAGNTVITYAISITNADVIMSDGKSLEHVGVIPDETVLPSGNDLANQRDPVLARAVEILGGNLPAEAAGKLFKYYYWKKD
ncbi:hypothetical protein BH10ACI1_BH10ACI1_01550 [soil metagenome]